MKIVGNILNIASGLIIHGCNAQGVMNSGIARGIREKWPVVFDVYKQTHETRGLKVGDIIPVSVGPRLIIVNAITQEFYGRDKNVVYVNYEGLQTCFSKIATLAKDTKLTVNYPLIGAGLANGDWKIISTLINQELHDIQHNLWCLS